MKSFSAVAVLLAGAFFVSGCKQIMEANAEVDQLTTKLLAAIADGKTDVIYDELASAEFRQGTSREDMKAFVAKFTAFGKPKNWERSGFELKTRNGVSTGEYEYSVTWEHGKGTLKLVAIQEGGSWKVYNVNIKADGKGAATTQP